MTIYRRYFKVTSGRLIDAVNEAVEINKLAHDQYKVILKEIGADETYYHSDHRISGLIFKTPPDSGVFKVDRYGAWWPKKNSKKGREILKRLEDVKVKEVQGCLSVVGLSRIPSLFLQNRAFGSALTRVPSIPPVIFVTVPWTDKKQEEIDNYKKERLEATHYDCSMDAILWEPTPEMQEIKKWEFEKAIDEWNASVVNQE